MKQRIVVTNLRIPEDEWVQIKTRATELGMSANDYIKQSLKATVTHNTKKKTIFEALEELSKTPNNPIPGGLSEEDETIYG